MMRARFLALTFVAFSLAWAYPSAQTSSTFRQWLAANTLTADVVLDAPIEWLSRATAGARIDAVTSDWHLVEVSPWTACGPDESDTDVSTGIQTATQLYERTVVLPPVNGGGTPPLDETRTVTQACAYTPPQPTELTWPSHWSELPQYGEVGKGAQPPAGWEDCSGYPEPRNFIEAQWHDAASGDLREARHMHVGACFPLEVKGIFQIDLRIITFHWNDATFMGLRKTVIRGADGIAKIMASPIRADLPGEIRAGLSEHMHKFYLPVRYNTLTGTSDGRKLFEYDIDIQRADGVHHLTRLQVPMLVNNGGGRPVRDASAGVIGAEGWANFFRPDGTEYSPASYLRAEMFNWDPKFRVQTSPPRFEDGHEQYFIVRGAGRNGVPITLLATMNPDLHLHPPAYGDVHLDEVPTSSNVQPFYVEPRSKKAGDRFMIRTADQVPGNPDGAFATLLVVTIGKSRQ